MPHDKNGLLIEQGDHVTVEFVVTQVSTNENECNVGLDSVEKMPGKEYGTSLSAINTKQCVKVVK
jgi:hypothetical protein